VGTLAAEAFPPSASHAPAAATPGAAAVLQRVRLTLDRVMPPFAWRRMEDDARAGAAGAAGGGASGSASAAAPSPPAAKRRRTSSGAAGALTRADVGAPLPGCITFAVGGEQVPALAFAMARASPIIRDALSCAAPDDADPHAPAAVPAVIPLPPLRGLAPAQHAALFRAAVEHAYTGRVHSLPRAELQPLWRLAHALAMDALKA
jgi:hypothetical protein